MNQVLETLEVLKYEEYWNSMKPDIVTNLNNFALSIEQTTDHQSMTFAKASTVAITTSFLGSVPKVSTAENRCRVSIQYGGYRLQLLQRLAPQIRPF